ncbi:MAG: hypothetical protein Q9209_005734, partial [Squamulea sp. 1 TL-2023]
MSTHISSVDVGSRQDAPGFNSTISEAARRHNEELTQYFSGLLEKGQKKAAQDRMTKSTRTLGASSSRGAGTALHGSSQASSKKSDKEFEDWCWDATCYDDVRDRQVDDEVRMFQGVAGKKG